VGGTGRWAGASGVFRVDTAFDGTNVTGRDEASICGALRTDLSVAHEKGAVGVVVSLDEADGAGA
jgi:hypothetical protein